MKPQAILIGFAAGLTAALLFVGLVLQSSLAFVLALLAPLPIYIASLGWGSYSGFLSAAVAGAVLALASGSWASGAVMLVALAAPAAYVGHLAGLSRPVTDGAAPPGEPQMTAPPVGAASGPSPGPPVEWYPLGKILLAIAAMSACASIFVGWLIGFDAATLGPSFADALLSQGADGLDPAASAEFRRMTQLAIDLVPLVQPALIVVVLVATLQIAAVLTRMSQRLNRPKDDVATATRLPTVALAAFALSIVGALAPGTTGVVATVCAGAFGAAFTLVGLASLHRRTRGRAMRGAILIFAYAAMLVLSFPIIAFTMLGVFETSRARLKPPAGQ